MNKKIIIRHKHFSGNILAGILTLFAWIIVLTIVILAFVAQLHVYSDSFVVLNLLLGINTNGVNHGMQIIMVCLIITSFPAIAAFLNQYQVKINDEKV